RQKMDMFFHDDKFTIIDVLSNNFVLVSNNHTQEWIKVAWSHQ
ncbi:hypothetical protein M153_2560002, partial [Pseudoloma neurophilia]